MNNKQEELMEDLDDLYLSSWDLELNARVKKELAHIFEIYNAALQYFGAWTSAEGMMDAHYNLHTLCMAELARQKEKVNGE